MTLIRRKEQDMTMMREYRSMLIFLIVLAADIVYFWTVDDNCGMGFAIMTFYMLIPVGSLLVTTAVAARGAGRAWVLIPLFGALQVLTGWLTYDLANTLAFGHWNMPDLEMALVPMAFAVIGYGIGKRIARRRQ